MIGFALDYSKTSEIEEKAIALYASMNHIPCKRFKKDEVPQGYIPVGNIDWFLGVTGWKIKPNYFPDFLRSYVKRNIWETDKWPLGQKVFIKPADRAKRFSARITTGTYRGKKKGPYWCSDIVSFKNEWRFYISKGEILFSPWYWGQDEGKQPPEINVDWPSDWVGTADFGESENGIELIEAHEPYSVGWYGTLTQHEIYAKWIIDGWEYMRSIYVAK